MKTKLVLSGQNEPVQKVINTLYQHFLVEDDAFQPPPGILPTTPVCRTVQLEVKTQSKARPELRLVDKKAPYTTKRVA